MSAMKYPKEYLLYTAFYAVAILGNDDVDADDLDGASESDRPLGCYATMLGAFHGKTGTEPLPPVMFDRRMDQYANAASTAAPS